MQKEKTRDRQRERERGGKQREKERVIVRVRSIDMEKIRMGYISYIHMYIKTENETYQL